MKTVEAIRMQCESCEGMGMGALNRNAFLCARLNIINLPWPLMNQVGSMENQDTTTPSGQA